MAKSQQPKCPNSNLANPIKPNQKPSLPGRIHVHTKHVQVKSDEINNVNNTSVKITFES